MAGAIAARAEDSPVAGTRAPARVSLERACPLWCQHGSP
jgi:hypothetical protein